MTAEPQGPESVAELVRRARAGDRGAFGELHGRYARMVHAILLARVAPGDAADLVQDVFLTAWRRMADLHEPAAFGGWIAAIARNAAVDHLRVRRLHDPVPDDLGAPAPPVSEVLQVLRAVRALPEAYRETLLMRLVEGMNGPEIAERTGMTDGSVRVNLHRGMQMLRDRLGVGRDG